MSSNRQETAIIIGAGPAGLTAALELCRRSSIKPIVLEASARLGGICCTIHHNGNRIDIGGHRFFSKSDRVMDWWLELMPLEAASEEGTNHIHHQRSSRKLPRQPLQSAAPSVDSDLVMLVRQRKSRIYFKGKFFDYPLSLSVSTLRRLGLFQVCAIALSYLVAKIFPRRPERSLEDFFINRFGSRLYRTFFKSYTEKVWGMGCQQISAAWGAQRIKGLSLRSAVTHFLKKLFDWNHRAGEVRQKNAETSLIERFLYPKYGPGQMWEHVAALVQESGGEVRTGWKVTGLAVSIGEDGVQRITSVDARSSDGTAVQLAGDYVFSTMPVRELLSCMQTPVPADVKAIADGLVYRDFITVGLLVDHLFLGESDGVPIQDTWIYVQDPEVKLGRVQIFNNWSPYLVKDPTKIWLGLEYFCNDSDDLWKKSKAEITAFAIEEISRIGLIKAVEVRDACVLRTPKTYPVYSGTYERFHAVVQFVERFENLFLIGRNGMHKYNNQDHSMLTAMVAVDNILAGVTSKSNLWAINTEEQYHETRTEVPASKQRSDDQAASEMAAA